jgi:hypothetical protein
MANMGRAKNMARVIRLAGAMVMGPLLLAGPLPATPCAAPPPPALPVAVVGAGTSFFSYACGGLTFSNFMAIDAGGATGLPINLVGATSDNTGTRRVDLSFNPDLGGSSVTDIAFYFTVAGRTNGIDVAVGGDRATITERACKTAIDVTGANSCTGGLGNRLAVLTNFSGQSSAAQSFGAAGVVSPVFSLKDINTGLDGALTTF